MPTIRLTETEIARLGKPGGIALPSEGQLLLWDEKQKGFGLRVTKTAKVYIVQSRVAGKDRRIKIGPVETISAEGARKKAVELLAQMHSGIDPNAVKAAERAKQKTLANVLEEYLKEKKLRPGTETLYRLSFRLALSDWSKRTLEQITREDVQNRYDKIRTGWRAVDRSKYKNGKEMGKQGTALASQAMRLLGQLFNFEIDVNNRDIHNPVKRLAHVRRGWTQSNQRTEIVQDSELPRFYESLTALQHEKTRDYFLLVLLTGLRAQEAAALEWSEVNLDDRCIRIRKERTKNGLEHGLPLTDFLLAMLQRRAELNKSEKSPFVFSGTGKTGHFVEPKTAFIFVSKRLGKKITPHTLRHTFATVSQRLDINPRIQSKLLNHAKKDITARYIHADIDMLRQPMEQIGKHFLDGMGIPSPEPDNTVVPIAAAKGKAARKKAK